VYASQIFELQSRKEISDSIQADIFKLISILELQEFCDEYLHIAHWGDIRRIGILFAQMEGKFIPHFKGFKL
jgi:coproporphyrinogen III oxidase